MDVATRDAAREERRFAQEAREVWCATARARENPYVDPTALRLVARMAVDATRNGSPMQVLRAIPRYMDARSSPRRIPEWATMQRVVEEDEARADEARRIDSAQRAAIAAAGVDPATVVRHMPEPTMPCKRGGRFPCRLTAGHDGGCEWNGTMRDSDGLAVMR